MHLCVPRSLPHCLSPYLTLYLTVPLFTPLSITHCLSLCLSLYLTLHLCASLYTSVCLSLCLSTPRASLTEVWSFRLELDKQSSFGKPTTIGPRGNYLHIPHAAISNLRKHEHVSVRMMFLVDVSAPVWEIQSGQIMLCPCSDDVPLLHARVSSASASNLNPPTPECRGTIRNIWLTYRFARA